MNRRKQRLWNSEQALRNPDPQTLSQVLGESLQRTRVRATRRPAPEPERNTVRTRQIMNATNVSLQISDGVGGWQPVGILSGVDWAAPETQDRAAYTVANRTGHYEIARSWTPSLRGPSMLSAFFAMQERPEYPDPVPIPDPDDDKIPDRSINRTALCGYLNRSAAVTAERQKLLHAEAFEAGKQVEGQFTTHILDVDPLGQPEAIINGAYPGPRLFRNVEREMTARYLQDRQWTGEPDRGASPGTDPARLIP